MKKVSVTACGPEPVTGSLCPVFPAAGRPPLMLIFVFPCLFLSAIAVEPYRQVVVSPNSASEVFYGGIDQQFVAAAPLTAVAASAVAVPAVAAPAVAAPAVAAPAVAAPAAFAAPLAAAPVAAVSTANLDYPQYSFGYSVQDFTTGDNKEAKEVREGGIVKGSYSLADPDGTKRTVNYYADPIHGFHAVVHKTQIL